MKHFKDLVEGYKTKKTADGYSFTTTDSEGGKLTISINKEKDTVTVSLNDEYYVATDDEVEAIVKLFK